MESAIRNLPGFLDYNKSLVTIGAAVFALCILAYAMSHSVDAEVDLHDPKVFQDRKKLYREYRDRFRNNAQARAELVEWKAMNDHYDYLEL